MMCRNLKDFVVGRIPDVEPEERFSQIDYIEERRWWLNQVKDEEIAVVAFYLKYMEDDNYVD